MTPVSAFAGTGHSSAANAPASHILRFMTPHPFSPSDPCRSPLRFASRFLSPALPFPTCLERNPSKLGTSSHSSNSARQMPSVPNQFRRKDRLQPCLGGKHDHPIASPFFPTYMGEHG